MKPPRSVKLIMRSMMMTIGQMGGSATIFCNHVLIGNSEHDTNDIDERIILSYPKLVLALMCVPFGGRLLHAFDVAVIDITTHTHAQTIRLLMAFSHLA